MMRKTLALFSLSLGIACTSPVSSVLAQVTIPLPAPAPESIPVPVPAPNTPEVVPALQPISPETACNSQRCLGWDEQLWGRNGDRQALLTSIDHSLRYLETNRAAEIYANYPIKEITLDRVRRSLLRFRKLVVSSMSAS